jgi:putative nucleotidyltransferase with HDIG domain
MTPRGGELGDRYVRQRAGCRSGCSERLRRREVTCALGGSSHSMKRTHTIAILVAIAAALALKGLASAHPLPPLRGHDLLGIASFLLVGIAAERMAIGFGSGRHATSSLAFLPFVSSILLFTPPVAVVVVGFVILVSTSVLARVEIWKIAFNVGQAMLSAAAGAIVYSQFLSDAQQSALIRESISTVGFPFLVCAFFGLNMVLTSACIASIRKAPLKQTLLSVIGPRGANLRYDLLASPIAIFPAALYGSLYIAAMATVLLPLLLIRSSYLSKLQLEEANQDLLNVLVKAIETRDPYTSGHSVRVATLARAIAEDMGLPGKSIQLIERAALLHDIGKIDLVFASLLRKPYDLSSEERELIQTHAAKGADLLKSLSSVSNEVIGAVRHHHERFDGKGYPDRLAAEQIPLPARIIMVCDSIDAMLSDRPYRSALSVGQVRSELVRCSGTQFDPQIVHVILCRSTLERAVQLVRDVESAESAELVLAVG